MGITTRRWHFYWRVWRLQFRIEAMRHLYGTGSSDRIVIQSSVIYDRAETNRLCGAYAEYPETAGGCTKPKGHLDNCGKAIS